MKKIKTLFILTSLLIIGSCETFDLEQTKSPSQVPVELLDPVYAFNYVQLQLPVFVDDANDFTQRVTRQMAMTGGNTYDNAFRPVNFNAVWSDGYNILNAVKVMEPKAIELGETYALGASKLIRVYVLLTMTDMFGDIPYTEALQGNANLTPKYDKSADIYKGLFIEIDEAIAYLGQTNREGSKIQDLYYNTKDSWITLANTLKLKMLNNARLAGSEIGVDIKSTMSAIISSGNIIDMIEEDFQFQYGNSRFNPNTRHPLYNDQYELGGGAYIGNYFMWAVSVEKGTIIDPRTNYYFYKQDDSAQDEDSFTAPANTRPSHYTDLKYRSFYENSILTPYFVTSWTGLNTTLLPAGGFWGRDHGNNTGIPPDAENRTVAGIYPIGGKYGTSPASVQSSGTAGQQGAGIMPIILSSYVHFILAEFQLTQNISSANALLEFELAVRQSISKTTSFIEMPSSVPPQATIDSQTTAYWNFLSSVYGGSTNDKKLELIIKEYYIASWGNGIEPYNNYRRTGYPSNFQPTLEEASGLFFATALYPASAANNNPNMPNNVRTKKVFWDELTTLLH
jgi:hypothetical protein